MLFSRRASTEPECGRESKAKQGHCQTGQQGNPSHYRLPGSSELTVSTSQCVGKTLYSKYQASAAYSIYIYQSIVIDNSLTTGDYLERCNVKRIY